MEQPLNNGAPGADLSALMRSALKDAAALGRDYLELTNVKLRVSADAAKRAVACLALGAVLAIVGIGQITYGVVGLILARAPAVQENARIMTASAVLCLVVAGVLAYAASRFVKKTVDSPKELAKTVKEDPLWQ